MNPITPWDPSESLIDQSPEANIQVSIDDVPMLYDATNWPQQFLTPPKLTADGQSYCAQLHIVARDENKASGKNEEWVFTPASSTENRKQALELSQRIIASADNFISTEDKDDFVEAVQGIASFLEGWLINDSASFNDHRERRSYMEKHDEPDWVLKNWLKTIGRLNVNGARWVDGLTQNIGLTGFTLPECMKKEWKIFVDKTQDNARVINGQKPLTDTHEPKRYQDWSLEDKILFGKKAEELAMEALQFLAKQAEQE